MDRFTQRQDKSAIHIPRSLVAPPGGGRSGRLRIVTNSIPVLEEIDGWAPHNLLMLGGIFLPEHQATVGPETLRGLQQFNATCAFLGCDGLTLEGGITSAHPLVAEVGRVMAQRAEQVIVLADSSKLEQAGFVPIIPLDEINLLITDGDAPKALVEGLRQKGVEVLQVD